MYQLDGYFRSSTTRANRLLVAPFVRVGYHIAVSLSIPFVALACNLKPAVSDAVGQAVMHLHLYFYLPLEQIFLMELVVPAALIAEYAAGS